MRVSSVIWLVIILILLVGSIYYFWIAPAASTIPSGSAAASASSSAYVSAGNAAGSAASTTLVLDTSMSTSTSRYLVAANGMTLYHFTRDTNGSSSCYGACAQLWPPYTISSSTASGTLATAAGVNGTTALVHRNDGSLQVSYNGEPLYFWYKDAKPGDTGGQGVAGTWFVVAP